MADFFGWEAGTIHAGGAKSSRAGGRARPASAFRRADGPARWPPATAEFPARGGPAPFRNDPRDTI
ncbi:hypothetical protein MOX02_40010 [Methylobacterium oxalidis]|uniref:Uncharacterized protein n=1 Tax=Methylobacterium oxalidis TaxID=944322 RepID=A0A512J7Q9_9HYPH|nr:hypothetical protein MOX02_40010 [Methylobacterium oxalidis]GLS66956.1 hypothetical protein GCM10007888_53390 [Methylobacterium oxalidis]